MVKGKAGSTTVPNASYHDKYAMQQLPSPPQKKLLPRLPQLPERTRDVQVRRYRAMGNASSTTVPNANYHDKYAMQQLPPPQKASTPTAPTARMNKRCTR